MRYFKPLVVLLFASCMPKGSSEEKVCFLNDFLLSQEVKLSESNMSLKKTIFYDGKVTDTLIQSPDWNKELSLFYSNLPDSSELLGKYEREEFKDGDRTKEIFAYKDKENNTNIIELIYSKGEITSLRMEREHRDRLSQQVLTISYNSLKSIGVKGNHSILSKDKKELDVFGEVVN